MVLVVVTVVLGSVLVVVDTVVLSTLLEFDRVSLGPGGSTQHFIEEDGHAMSSRTS